MADWRSSTRASKTTRGVASGGLHAHKPLFYLGFQRDLQFEHDTFKLHIRTMIQRTLLQVVHDRSRQLPIVTITGPRQSGKTTLCRNAFPDKPYISLETPDVREEVLRDPRKFLAGFPDGAILDEVQRVPEIASYLQEIVDTRGRNGDWVLTGSEHFALVEKVTQSLAGRTAMLQLLPLSYEELRPHHPSADVNTQILRGGYPRLYDQPITASAWFADYVMNYVERDVRRLLAIGDLAAFHMFLRMCAGRVGQVLNLSALGADCGVSHATARRWMSVLEASYVVFRLQPVHRNVTKRLTKSPKLYFFDSGLACHLLGIRTNEELTHHQLRGALFENWVVTEVLKWGWNRGSTIDLAYYRDARGEEIDLVVEKAIDPIALEVKASDTPPLQLEPRFRSLEAVLRSAPVPPRQLERRIVYAGGQRLVLDGIDILPWSDVDQIRWD